MVATPLPMMLVSALTSLMNLSIPKMIASPDTSLASAAARVPARVTKPAPVAEHAGRLATKDELMHALWSGLVVTDDSLVQVHS